MIKMVRLDERLIHGQVATKWSRLLGVDRIIVADDDAAANDVMQKTLMMAAPDNVKVAIVPVDRAVALCNDPRSATLEILAIVATPESLLKVVSEVRGVDRVNIGNYGRVAPKRGGRARVMYDANVYADAEEAAVLEQVASLGVPCTVQTIPDDAPRDLMSVLNSKR